MHLIVLPPQEQAECARCSGPHDEAIHDATLRIHNWFRGEIERRTREADFAFGATVEAVAASIVQIRPSGS
ncbi:MAG: hypothetical protein KGN36_09530 [Acidobacteriota bacterium]|nr:hypothetical protein [Acidobacteriota bacterium]